MSDPRPIYVRIADELRDNIDNVTLHPGDRAPSTNELSAFHSVNPTTSGKALALLVFEGLLEKRRGLGMFVVPGARDTVLAKRQADFAATFIRPLLAEARLLGLDDATVDKLIDSERNTR